MRAAWYDRRGPAAEVLEVGELPDVEPTAGEVRIKVEVSGLSPGDIKKREGPGQPMPYPRVIPHSDGAGVIDAVGPGADPDQIGQRVWCYGAQSYRPFGTAAEYVRVPDGLAVALPGGADAAEDRMLAEQAACLGIAGITAHRAVFADGSVDGLKLLIHGAVGGVGTIATQLAVRDGATVIAGIRDGQQARARELGARHVVVTDSPEAVAEIRAIAPAGVDRIAEVEFTSHIDLDAGVIAIGGVIASYYSARERPEFPYMTLGFADTTLRLLSATSPSPMIRGDSLSAAVAVILAGLTAWDHERLRPTTGAFAWISVGRAKAE
jgi:NADPH:quinone reductase